MKFDGAHEPRPATPSILSPSSRLPCLPRASTLPPRPHLRRRPGRDRARRALASTRTHLGFDLLLHPPRHLLLHAHPAQVLQLRRVLHSALHQLPRPVRHPRSPPSETKPQPTSTTRLGWLPRRARRTRQRRRPRLQRQPSTTAPFLPARGSIASPRSSSRSTRARCVLALVDLSRSPPACASASPSRAPPPPWPPPTAHPGT